MSLAGEHAQCRGCGRHQEHRIEHGHMRRNKTQSIHEFDLFFILLCVLFKCDLWTIRFIPTGINDQN